MAGRKPGSTAPHNRREVPKTGLIPVDEKKSGLVRVDYDTLISTFFAGKDPDTIRVYQRCLENFREFYGGKTVTETAKKFLAAGQGPANLAALQFKNHLKDEKYAPSTINTHLVAIRSLVTLSRVLGMVPWTVEVENVPMEIYRDTKGPGTDAFVKKMGELEKNVDPMSVRDRAILTLLHDLGLRRGEVVQLDYADMDFPNHRIWILGKKRTAKETVPLNEETEAALKSWIEIRGEEPGSLFKNFDRAKKSDRLNGASVRRISHKYGLGRPHGLRHLAITEACEVTGGNIVEVMKFSRHKDPKTVMIYNDKAKEVSGEVARKIAGLRKKKET